LPKLEEGEKVDLKEIEPKQHFTQPPPRYTEASLIKVLEENGIGRPSTYAPTISTIQDRNYVTKEEKRLHPTDMAYVVNDILVDHFSDIVDYQFTAEMEDDLDKIATGEKKWQKIIKDFYDPFIKNLENKDKTLTKKELTEEKTSEKCEKCGSDMVIKIGRFGKFMACSNYPDCKTTKQLPGDDKEQQEPEISDEKCEKCGKPMVIKIGRYGKFLGCSGYPDCKSIKKIVKKTGVKCPKCNKGNIVEKRTRGKKIFYACDQYPDCEFALWSKPTGDKCPECDSLLVY
jgi:DNA topoisomerase-1